MKTLLINTKHSETLYKIATILDDAKIDNCKIDAEDTDNGIIIHVTPIIEYKCGDYVEFENGAKGVLIEKSNPHFHDGYEYIHYDTRSYLNIKRKLARTEIIEVNERFAKCSYKINHSTLKLEKLPHRAKKGTKFYFMGIHFEELERLDNRDETSNKLYESGNYFIDKINRKEFIKRVIKNR
jgi:hypothetical protein